jgi:hypothetical protein
MGDDAREPRFVRTVQGFGYAFCGPAEETEEPLRLPAARLVWGDRRLPLYEGPNVVGRDPGADACIDADTVSRRHARITIQGERVALEDLGSKNGTGVGGEDVDGPHALAHGDEIRLGEVWVTFERPSATDSTRSASGVRAKR